MWSWANVIGKHEWRYFMSNNIINLQYILEKSRRIDSEFHDDYSVDSSNKLDLLRHQLLDLAYYNYLGTSTEIDKDLNFLNLED